MKKYILTVAISTALVTVAMAQLKITDQFGNLKTVQNGTEPWNVQGGVVPATSNTQNIYQMGKVAVGLTTGETNSTVHIKGPGIVGENWGSQLMLSDNGSSNPILALNVAGKFGAFIGVDRGSGTFYITPPFGDPTKNDLNSSKFVMNSFGSVGLGVINPTQYLDVNGNARIRSLADGSNTTNFPKIVVAKTDGTLGQSDISAVRLNVFARIGMSYKTFTANTEAPIIFRFDNGPSAFDMSNTPGGTMNFIDKLPKDAANNSSVWNRLEYVTVPAGTQTSNRTTDRLELAPGIYRLSIRINFTDFIADRLATLKVIVNNAAYSNFTLSGNGGSFDEIVTIPVDNATYTNPTDGAYRSGHGYLDFTLLPTANLTIKSTTTATTNATENQPAKLYNSVIILEKLF